MLKLERYGDGWCAMVGEDAQVNPSGIGKTRINALLNLALDAAFGTRPASINEQNPIVLYPAPEHGRWVAKVNGIEVWGEDAGVLVEKLLSNAQIAEFLPHAALNLSCPHCGEEWVGVVPVPNEGRFECPQCHRMTA